MKQDTKAGKNNKLNIAFCPERTFCTRVILNTKQRTLFEKTNGLTTGFADINARFAQNVRSPEHSFLP